MQIFRNLWKKTTPFEAPLQPDATVAVIGDVHGQIRLLDRLFDQIARLPNEPHTVVLVGDYIDRGDQSAEVLTRLKALSDLGSCIALRGNHEDMLLSFLDLPEENGSRWLQHGGLQTLASYRLTLASATPGPEELRVLAEDLTAKMGEELLTWLRGLKTHWQTGNVCVVHAAADPELSIPEQSKHALLWGHKEFRKKTRADGVWIVHGHTIVPSPVVEDGVISVDTGAYATGRLTAAIIAPERVDFLTVDAAET